jgi:Protein of unknown function (DUF429)
MRAIAVDWSGDVHTARKHIWLAEATDPDHLVRLESGRDISQLAAHLLSLPSNNLVIGFDFAFSFPAWFLSELGIQAATELWALVAQRGEEWLSRCEPPFWGRPGKRRPPQTQPALRRTDTAVPRTAGIAPKSIFQIGGAGAVGTGSIRGMPVLHQLSVAGARVWPFSRTGAPLVLEIYPRLFTGPVHKSNTPARAALLDARYPALDPWHRALAVGSEDAFDAAVSAMEMARHAHLVEELPYLTDPLMELEGRIWHPRWHDDRL